MADVNCLAFTGRVGQDAVVKVLPSGKTIMELSVANTCGYGDNKKTTWLKVKMWGERTHNIKDLFKKGCLVGGTGEMTQEQWTGRDGVTRTDIVVTVFNLQLLSSPKPVEPLSEGEIPEEDDAPEF